MYYQDVELHNVAEAMAIPGYGVQLQRVPESVRKHLSEHGQERMLDAAGTEIRFAFEGERASVSLRCLSGQSLAQVFLGDFRTSQVQTIGAELTTIDIEHARWFTEIPREQLDGTGFSHHIGRVLLYGGTVCLQGIQGTVRRPLPEELPSLRYLAYGTSITQGGAASMRHLCYASQTAWRLKADLINLGMSSSAFCEPELADYIASREDWDIATLALSTNMSGFELDEFRKRTEYMVNKVAGANTGRPVACITLWPKTADLGPEHQGSAKAMPEAYRQVLRDVVAACPHPNVHLLEGRKLLPEMRGLSPDLLHPNDYGHTIMAENLARELKALIK